MHATASGVTTLIEVQCQCGRSLKARNEHAGQSAICPYCRGVVLVVLPTLEPADPVAIKAITLDVGAISRLDGHLSLSVHVTADGRGRVFVHASSLGRRGLDTVILNMKQFEQLKDIVRDTDQTITRLKTAGQIAPIIEG